MVEEDFHQEEEEVEEEVVEEGVEVEEGLMVVEVEEGKYSFVYMFM